MANVKPLLVIELNTIDSVPRLFYKGERISGNVKMAFDWETSTDVLPGKAQIAIDHYSGRGKSKPVLTKIRDVRP